MIAGLDAFLIPLSQGSPVRNGVMIVSSRSEPRRVARRGGSGSDFAELLQDGFGLRNECGPFVLLGDGQRIGRQCHGFLMTSLLMANLGEGQSCVHRFRRQQNDVLKNPFSFFRITA